MNMKKAVKQAKKDIIINHPAKYKELAEKRQYLIRQRDNINNEIIEIDNEIEILKIEFREEFEDFLN